MKLTWAVFVFGVALVAASFMLAYRAGASNATVLDAPASERIAENPQ